MTGGSMGLSPLIGHDELIALTTRVARGSSAGHVVAMVDEPGVGRTLLLRHAMDAARAADVRVFFAAGGSRADDYSSLIDLILPVAAEATALPAMLSDALRPLVASHPPLAESVSPLAAQAVLALFESISARSPLLIAIDNLDGFDSASRDVVSYVVNRLIGTRLCALLTVRDRAALNDVDRSVQVIDVPALGTRHAAELLDAQPHRTAASIRGELLRWAAGNPLAIVEAARTYGRTEATIFQGLRVVGVGGSYSRFVRQFTGLPAHARGLALYAAAAGSESIDALTAAAGLGEDFTLWEPAISAGLLRIGDDRTVEFGHPLARSAAYNESPLGQRHECHLRLAHSPHVTASCRAWQRAIATSSPDEVVAAELEATTVEPLRPRRGFLDNARALQRAAELSPCRDDAGRRYGLAAASANFGGDLAWALMLSDKASRHAEDVQLQGYAALTRASVLLHSAHPLEAFCLIQTVLNGPTPPRGKLAVDLLYIAASAAYYSGEARHRQAIRRWLDQPGWTAEPEPADLLTPFPVGLDAMQWEHIRILAETPDSPRGRPSELDDRWRQPGPAAEEPYRRVVCRA